MRMRQGVKQRPILLGYQTNIAIYKRGGTLISKASFQIEFYSRLLHNSSFGYVIPSRMGSE